MLVLGGLQSTELEASAHKTDTMDEEFYIANRQNTGGACNAFALLCFMNEINISKVLDEHVQLKYMIRMMADSVGILNDLYSLPKELKEIQKKIESSGLNPNDPTEIKKHVSSNIVLIKWKNGESIEDSIAHAIALYEQKISGFMKMKKTIDEELSSNPELQTTLYCLTGWLSGHPTWALGSGRYNPKATLTSESYVDFLSSLQQFLC